MIIKVRENLELRTLVSGNADEVFETVDKNRQYLRTYLPWVDDTKSSYDTGRTIERWKIALKEKREFIFGIFLGGNYIGNIGLHDMDKNINSAMIGYWLAQDYQGRGIMTDCVRGLTDFGFYKLDLNRIYITCAFGNKKSRAIPERLGYVREAVLQDGTCLYGVYHDKVIYGVVKRNWEKKS